MANMKLYIGGALLAVAFLAGWTVQGWRSDAVIANMQADADKAAKEAQAEAQAKTDRINELQDELAQTVAEKQALESQEAEVLTRTITEKVIEYVQSPDAGNCNLPNQWVRVHDAAARGMPPTEDTEAPGGTNDTASGITDIEALQVATGNYATCNAIATRLRNLQLWARGLQNGTEE